MDKKYEKNPISEHFLTGEGPDGESGDELNFEEFINMIVHLKPENLATVL